MCVYIYICISIYVYQGEEVTSMTRRANWWTASMRCDRNPWFTRL